MALVTVLPGGMELKSKRTIPLRLAPLSGLTSISGKEPKFELGLLALIKASSEGVIPGGIPVKQIGSPGVGVGVFVGVADGVGVVVGVLVAVGVGDNVGLADGVGVFVAVLVAVGVGEDV